MTFTESSGGSLVVGGLSDLPSARTVTSVLVICIMTVIIALFVVSLRLYTRFRYITIKMDDWLMAVAMVFFFIFAISISITADLVKRRPDVTLKTVLTAINFLNVSEVFYITTIIALKLSLGIFFLRIVQTPLQRRLVQAAMVANSIFGVAMLFFAIFQCGYYKDAMGFIIKRFSNQCASDATALGMTYTHAIITMMTDWTFLLMPLWILRGSLMSFREKVTIGCILAFASLSGIASIVRFPYISHFSGDKTKFFAGVHNIAIWSCLEPGIGIICGSLVTLRPLLRRFAGSNRRTTDAEPDVEELPSFVIPITRPDNKSSQMPAENFDHGAYEHSETDAQPGLPVGGEKNVYLAEIRQTTKPKTRRRGKLFGPLSSRGRMSGFGLRLFGSSFAHSTADTNMTSSLTKSVDTDKSGFSEASMPENALDRVDEEYARRAIQNLIQSTAISRPPDSRGSTYSQTLIKQSDRLEPPHLTPSTKPRQYDRSARTLDEARTSRMPVPYRKPVNTPISSINTSVPSIISSPAIRSPEIHSPLSPDDRRFKPLPPPPPAATRDISRHFSHAPKHTVDARESRHAPQGPGLPLHLFSTESESVTEDTSRWSWL